MAHFDSKKENFQHDYDDPPMPEGLLDMSPNSNRSVGSNNYNLTPSDDSENSEDFDDEDSEKNESIQENLSVRAHDLAKSQIQKIENEMKKMHQKHCQLLKDMDNNYSAIEQETHQRYIEFINKWKDQLKSKIEQYRKIIESMSMENSELKDFNSTFQEKITKMLSEKNALLASLNKVIEEKEEFKKKFNDLQISNEIQVRAIQKEKNELFSKIEEISNERDNFREIVEETKAQNAELQKEVKKYKKIESELLEKIQQVQQNYANDISSMTIDSLLYKIEDSEIIRENILNLKKEIEYKRKKKVNFKKQITQWMDDFKRINGRPCENSDKEQIKHLYTKYIETNKKCEVLQKRLDSMKGDMSGKKINFEERNPTPRKMRSKSPSCNLNVSVDSVNSNPPRKTPREESSYKDRAESLEKENAQLRKEIRLKLSINGRSANQTPTSVANNIIVSANSLEMQQLKAERDQLKTELSRFQAILRDSKKESFDPVLVDTQQQLETWKNKANDIEKTLKNAQSLVERYKQDYESLINKITESQDSDNAELSTLKSQLSYCNSELMLYRDKLLTGDSQNDLNLLYEKKKLSDENANLYLEVQKLKDLVETNENKYQEKIKEIEMKNTNSIKQIHEELQKLRRENIKLQESSKDLKTLKEKFKEEKKALVDSNLHLDSKVTGLLKEIHDLKQYQMQKEQELKDSVRQRRLLHNQLEDLRGKIRVFCRVRPMNEEEQRLGCSNIVSISDEFSLNFEVKPGQIKTHVYDTVFGPNVGQEEIFEDVRRLIQSAVDGYNVCIFAYGQTGSGKTHTIQGYNDCPGITPRGIDEIYSILNNLPQGYSYSVSCYMVELYIQQIIDLLRPKSQVPPASLTIKTDSKGMNYLPEVTLINTYSAQELRDVYESGIKNRHICKTKMNDKSSRSHLIFCVIINVANNESEVKSIGKISFVDLAGSEKLEKSDATTKGLKETIAINKSLSALGDVISALINKEPHIPYRNNKLTMLMSDSIGGTSKTLMFVNISPASINREETISSLHYGDKMKLIANEPIKNIESKELSRLRNEINLAYNLRDKYKNMLVEAGIISKTDEDINNEE